MNIKTRLQKLEAKKNTNINEVVFFMDGICTYRDKKYTKEEFDKEFPSFKNCIEITME